MGTVTTSDAALTVPDIVSLGLPAGEDTRQVVEGLAALLGSAGRVSDVGAFVDAVMEREKLGSTALPGGIALPHARSATVTTPSVAVARLAAPVVFAEGRPAVDVALLIAAPDDAPELYLSLLSKLASACVTSSFQASLRSAATAGEVADLVTRAVGRL